MLKQKPKEETPAHMVDGQLLVGSNVYWWRVSGAD